MLRQRWRQVSTRSCVLGTLVTLVVVLLDATGRLERLERILYDTRAQYFQHFTPAPNDRLVHLDIDDAALETIGRWPWPRSTLADIVDELRLAGADALAMDIIFTEPQRPEAIRHADGRVEVVADHDENFAAALKRFDRALVPVSFEFEAIRETPPRLTALAAELRSDLELSLEQAAARASQRAGSQLQFTEDEYLIARKQAIAERIAAEQAQQRRPLDELKRQLLPRSVHLPGGSSLLREFDDQYRREEALAELRRFALPGPSSGELPPMLTASGELLVIPTLSRASRFCGFVNYLSRADDPAIRSVPLVITHHGKLYPQMDLVMACAALGTDVRDVRLEPSRVIIPRRGGSDIAVPVREVKSDVHGKVGMFLDLPWFGGRDWKTMYDPAGREARQHVPVTLLWALADYRRQLAHHFGQVAKASQVLADVGIDVARDLTTRPPSPADTSDAIARMDRVVREATELIGPTLNVPASELSTEERVFLDAYRAVTQVRDDTRLFEQKAATLRGKLSGKTVLLGWTATGGIDAHPTSLHSTCPGVVIHGVAFNALVTGHFWYRAPMWVTLLIALGLGLVMTAATAFLSPYRALTTAFTLGIGYTLVNALALFDYGNWIVGLAGPLTAVVMVWALLTLVRLVVEAKERARITRRFQSYVDPSIVKYVIDHPELARLEGEVREMTVCFTDLAGFTTLTETYREKMVPVLGRYISRMVPHIRRNRGLVHRFMGDGIMFSFNAPIANPHQASDAVAAVLEMHEEVERFNEEIVADGFPRLSMRAGVCTGPAVIGDSGAEDATEYACLGDTTNVAARLEGANKSMGTQSLISGRTAAMLDGRFLVRPIGRLRVMGRREAVMAYEPLAATDKATDQQKQIAELTTVMFDHYTASRFADCIAAADALEAVTGPTKLINLYRETSRRFEHEPPADFQGELVLEEK